jgi:hypothetical protein
MNERVVQLFVHNSSAALVILFVLLAALYAGLSGAANVSLVFVIYALILTESRVRLRQYIHGFRGAPTITRLLRSVIYFLPILFLRIPLLESELWGIPLGLACGVALQMTQLSDLRFTLSREFVDLLSPLTQEDKFRDAFHPVLSAIAQEYFYRFVMISVLAPFWGTASIFISAICFVLEHLMHFNSVRMWDRRDLTLQLLLSLGLGTVFYFSHSWLGVMLGHAAYNSPSVIQTLRRPVITTANE